MKKFLILSVLIVLFTGCNPKSEKNEVKIEDEEIKMVEVPVEEILRIKDLLLKANKNNIKEKISDNFIKKNVKHFIDGGPNSVVVEYYKDKELPNDSIYFNGEICKSKDDMKDSCLVSDVICPSGLKFVYNTCNTWQIQNVSGDEALSGPMVSLVKENGKIIINFGNIKNNYVIDATEYRDDGKPLAYMTLKDKSSDSPVRVIKFNYYDNGKLQSKKEMITYSGSFMDIWKNNSWTLNIITLYYKNGNMKVKSFLKNDKEVGVWNYYNEDGKLNVKVDFNDVIDGYVKRTTFFKDYYKTEYANKEGKSNGWVSSYDNNGKLIFQFDVKDSVMLGNGLYYDDNGKLVTKVFKGKDKSYFEEYYDDGSLKERFDGSLDNDDVFKSSLYYPNGDLKSKVEYDYGNILYKDFYDNGKERYNISVMNDEDKSYCINEKGEKIDIKVPEGISTIDFIDLGCGKFQFVSSDRNIFKILNRLKNLKD